MAQEDHILVAVLDWGLGHATRSSVLIDRLLLDHQKITIASSGKALLWLNKRYPNIEVKEKPGVEISYSQNHMNWKLALQAPSFLLSIKKEKAWTQKIVSELGITQIYSDNCYGVYHHNIQSIFITHQLNFDLSSFAKASAKKLIERLISPFDEIQIPDLQGGLLSGFLSENSLTNVSYLGPLSRFSSLQNGSTEFEWVGVISGPEPNRSSLLKRMSSIFQEHGGNHVIFSGESKGSPQHHGNTIIVPQPTDQEMKNAMHSADLIICRSGYSSLMDLHSLQRKALLIPTKNQPEQEYLAKYFETSFGFTSIEESTLTLEVVQKLMHDNPLNFGSFVL